MHETEHFWFENTELRRLREKILALVPRNKIARVETDHEALLEAQGFASRPGPAARIAPEIASTISLALKSSQRLKIVYQSHGSAKSTTRVVEPYGVLIGIRRYLVAKPKADTEDTLRYYVAERIRSAELTGEGFVRDPGFNIDQHAQKAFGAFQNDAEYDEVIWKFMKSLERRSFLKAIGCVADTLPSTNAVCSPLVGRQHKRRISQSELAGAIESFTPIGSRATLAAQELFFAIATCLGETFCLAELKS